MAKQEQVSMKDKVEDSEVVYDSPNLRLVMKVQLDPNTVNVMQNVQQLTASLATVSQRLNADPTNVSEDDFRKSFGLARAMAQSILSKTEFLVEQVTPGDFEFFRKLPVELRLKIWMLMMPSPRVLALCAQFDPATSSDLMGPGKLNYKLFSNQKSPKILGICQESRAEAVKTLKPHLKTAITDCPMRLDLDEDILYFTGLTDKGARHRLTDWTRRIIRAQTLKSVKHIAIRSAYMDWFDGEYKLTHCTALKTITVVEHAPKCVFRWKDIVGKELSFETLSDTSPYWAKFPQKWTELQQMPQIIQDKFSQHNSKNPDCQVPEVTVKVLCVEGKRCCITDKSR